MIAVIGSDSLVVRAALDGTGAEIIENPEWREGLSTSLRRGVASVSPLAEAVVVALADQPDVRPDIIRALIDVWRQTGASDRDGALRGVRAPPVLLARPGVPRRRGARGGRGREGDHGPASESVGYVDIDATCRATSIRPAIWTRQI